MPLQSGIFEFWRGIYDWNTDEVLRVSGCYVGDFQIKLKNPGNNYLSRNIRSVHNGFLPVVEIKSIPKHTTNEGVEQSEEILQVLCLP